MVGETTTEEKDNQEMDYLVLDTTLVEPFDGIDLEEVLELFAVSFILNDPLQVIIIHLMAVTEPFELLDDVEAAFAQSVNALEDEAITVRTGHVFDEGLDDIFHVVGCVVKLIKRLYQIIIVLF